MNTLNLLGIDFEEWYHPELIQPYIKNQKTEPKIIAGIDKILNLLRENDTLATFFVVGELLEHTPELLDKIIDNGHEIGFHTMHHTNLNHNGFKDDFDFEVKKFAELTEKKSRGFRAPTFSLNSSSSWAIDILEKNNSSLKKRIEIMLKSYDLRIVELEEENAKIKEEYSIPFYLNKNEKQILEHYPEMCRMFGINPNKIPTVDHWISGDGEMKIDDFNITYLETPGHTPGGTTYMIDGHCFCGDTLFSGSIGRTDFPGGNFTTLMNSLEKLKDELNHDWVIHPGHGPKTSMRYELKHNPFLDSFNC